MSFQIVIRGGGWFYLTKSRDSLGVKGAKMFNLLPVWVRTLNGVSVDRFKSELDKFLSIAPDQPTCPGRQRAAVTNSLLDQLQHIF